MLSKEKLEKLKLNSEENVHLNDFIGRSVRRNDHFTILSNKAGVTVTGGIQQVYNQNTETLINYAGILDSQIKKTVVNFNPLDEGESVHMSGKVRSDELLRVLQLIIREKTYIAERNRRADELLRLKGELERMKSPSEVKTDLEKEIALLEQY